MQVPIKLQEEQLIPHIKFQKLIPIQIQDFLILKNIQEVDLKVKMKITHRNQIVLAKNKF